MKPRVAIIILSWNGMHWLKKCLSSVLASSYNNFQVMVVDNGSTDGSVQFIEKNFPQVDLIKNSKNLGFAEGNNVGIRKALSDGADYIALLNQDIIVDPGWLTEIVKEIQREPNIGLASPLLYDYEGVAIDPALFKVLNKNPQFMLDYSIKKLQSVYEVERLFGAALILSSSFCYRVGLFDPLYFCYREEADLCRRAKYFGYRMYVITDSRVQHWHSMLQTTHKPSFRRRMLLLRYLRNHFIYMLKNPNRSFVQNLACYFRSEAKGRIKELGDLRNTKFLIKILVVQAWILALLPIIAYRHRREKLGACYLNK